MGCPVPSFIAASMSAVLATPRSCMATACARKGTSSRFTTKPGVSVHSTGVFPCARTSATAAAVMAGEVEGSEITSHSAISGTGLK